MQHGSPTSSAGNSSDGGGSTSQADTGCGSSGALSLTGPQCHAEHGAAAPAGPPQPRHQQQAPPLPPLPPPWQQPQQPPQQQQPLAFPVVASSDDNAAGPACVMQRLGSRESSLPSSNSSQSLSLAVGTDECEPCPAASAAAPGPGPCSSASSRSSPDVAGGRQVQAQAREQQQQRQQRRPALLDELGVPMETLVRLFTAGASAEFEQPVWMVVNLQAKIKGSYTADKMMDFCRRGTLSSSQLLLGIDRNLPYITRQDLRFYRRLDELVAAVHAGATYGALTQAAAAQLSQHGLQATQWQPTQQQPQQQLQQQPQQALRDSPTGAAGQEGAVSPAGSSGSGRTLASAGEGPAPPAAAAVQLQAALERLCGCSMAAARQEDPSAAATDSPTGSASPAPAAQAAATAATAAAGPSGSAASSRQSSEEPAAAQAAAAAEAPGAASSDPKQPLWLYINHVGMCRGPFPGAKVMQAHLCGRLPRDTLVAALEPEVPASMLTLDVSYFFRPLGVLLDNVANGWTYKPVGWKDVAVRGVLDAAAAAAQTHGSQQQQQQQQWQPLAWEGIGDPPPLVDPCLLLPPTNVPTPQGAAAMGEGGPGRRGRGDAGSSTGGSKAALQRRRRLSQQQQQQQQQQVMGVAASAGLTAYLLPHPASPAQAGLQQQLQVHVPHHAWPPSQQLQQQPAMSPHPWQPPAPPPPPQQQQQQHFLQAAGHAAAGHMLPVGTQAPAAAPDLVHLLQLAEGGQQQQQQQQQQRAPVLYHQAPLQQQASPPAHALLAQRQPQVSLPLPHALQQQQYHQQQQQVQLTAAQGLHQQQQASAQQYMEHQLRGPASGRAALQLPLQQQGWPQGAFAAAGLLPLPGLAGSPEPGADMAVALHDPVADALQAALGGGGGGGPSSPEGGMLPAAHQPAELQLQQCSPVVQLQLLQQELQAMQLQQQQQQQQPQHALHPPYAGVYQQQQPQQVGLPLQLQEQQHMQAAAYPEQTLLQLLQLQQQQQQQQQQHFLPPN